MERLGKIDHLRLHPILPFHPRRVRTRYFYVTFISLDCRDEEREEGGPLFSIPSTPIAELDLLVVELRGC